MAHLKTSIEFCLDWLVPSVVSLSLLCLLSLLAFTQETSAVQDRPGPQIEVVATTGMVGDIARNVGGQWVRVVDLIPTGVDPHLYKATRSDVRTLTKSDIVFYSGLMLEGRMGDILVQVARMGKPVYAVTELIDPSLLLEPEDFEGHYDPHLWMDISVWMHTVDVVCKALVEIDPAHSDDFRKNAASYREKLREVDEYAATSIASIPHSGRKLITAHDAFNYFSRRYEIDVMGIQGISTASEAGLHDINSLLDVVVADKIKAIFVESSISDKNVRAIIEGARARGHEIELGGVLFSDAMGPEGSYEGTYIGMMDHNVTVVTRGLGGQAPKGGMQGKLRVAAEEETPAK